MLLSLRVCSVGVEDDVTGSFANHLFIKGKLNTYALSVCRVKGVFAKFIYMALCVFVMNQIDELLKYFK